MGVQLTWYDYSRCPAGLLGRGGAARFRGEARRPRGKADLRRLVEGADRRRSGTV